MKKFNLKKIAVVVSSFALFGGGVAVGAMHQTSPRVQANATKTHILHVGDAYKLGNLSLKISTYDYKGKNIVITTNLRKKEFYQVASNDDKQGKTRGVTVAFGNDQK